MSEITLLENYRNGCNDSLSLLYMKYYGLFMKVSKKYLCDTEEAEDLIQSVIERLLCLSTEKRVERFSNINSISSYFYTMIKNAALDHLRKKRLSYVSIDNALTNNITEETDCISLELQYKNAGLSATEMIYFEEYLQGKKPRYISAKYSKNISTIKNTLNTAKRKIILKYKASNYLFE